MPIGVPELLIILAILLLLFGAKRLPTLGRQLGGGMREFKDSVTRRVDRDDDEPEERPALAAATQSTAPASSTADQEPAVGERPADS